MENPVSPSPNKEKRRRVGSQLSLPFANLGVLTAHSDDDDDGDDAGEANSSFVDDSPVKAPAGSKSFKLLFEEALPKNDAAAKRKGPLSRSKTTPASGLFGDRNVRSTSVGTLMKVKMDQGYGPTTKLGAKCDRRGNGDFGQVTFPGRLTLGKDDLLVEAQSDTSQSYKSANKWDRHSSASAESEARRLHKTLPVRYRS